MTLTRKLIRTDGTTKVLPPGMSMRAIRELIGAESLDTVALHHLGEPLHVMLIDDDGWEFEIIEHSPNHFEHRPTSARKPVNAEATRLYLANCRPGTTHQIVGNVVVMPDLDFA
jgi:hypothetical protein